MDFVSHYITLLSLFFICPNLPSLHAIPMKYLEELLWNQTHFCWIEQMAEYEELRGWQSPLRVKHIMLTLSMHQGGIQAQLNRVAGILVYL